MSRQVFAHLLYGTEMLSYLRPKIWNLVTFDIRNCVTEQFFAKRLENRNQMDVHVSSAKYTFLI